MYTIAKMQVLRPYARENFKPVLWIYGGELIAEWDGKSCLLVPS